jgi:hypothetical protein
MVPVACTAEGVGSGRVARITCPGPKAPALVLNELSAFPGATALRWKTYRRGLHACETIPGFRRLGRRRHPGGGVRKRNRVSGTTAVEYTPAKPSLAFAGWPLAEFDLQEAAIA